jgi:exosortase/archaeosortase
LIAETIAGFMVVFMYLCSTEDKTKFTKNAVLQTIVLACAYYSAMLLGGQNVKGIKLSPVNPAIALAMTFIFAKNA